MLVLLIFETISWFELVLFLGSKSAKLVEIDEEDDDEDGEWGGGAVIEVECLDVPKNELKDIGLWWVVIRAEWGKKDWWVDEDDWDEDGEAEEDEEEQDELLISIELDWSEDETPNVLTLVCGVRWAWLVDANLRPERLETERFSFKFDEPMSGKMLLKLKFETKG